MRKEKWTFFYFQEPRGCNKNGNSKLQPGMQKNCDALFKWMGGKAEEWSQTAAINFIMHVGVLSK